MSTERRPLTLALLLSLLMHGLLLSLTFGGQGWGLPGFGFPWQERRVEAPELRVVLLPTPASATAPVIAPIEVPAPPSPIKPRTAGKSAQDRFVASVSILDPAKEAIAPRTQADIDTPAPPQADAVTDASPDTAVSPSQVSAEVTAEPAPVPTPEPTVLAVEHPSEWVVAPIAASAPVPTHEPVSEMAIAPAPSASGVEAASPASDGAADAAQAQAANAAAAARAVQDAEQQAALREAAQLETARAEAARREAERALAQRLETERQQLADQEQAKQEAARQAAQLAEAARLSAEREERARSDAERRESARQEAIRAEAAQDEARREASRRAMGRQLDEEAARREAASVAANLAPRREPSSSGARRGRLFGRTDPNDDLVFYAEAWARKIELNLSVDRVRDVAKRPHSNPLVTVAIRSDGSVESVTFLLSSGVAEIDDAIRRIVESLLPYPAFPPALAREYDVIEIRRTWLIDTAVRLY